jgi:hypothetical protein
MSVATALFSYKIEERKFSDVEKKGREPESNSSHSHQKMPSLFALFLLLRIFFLLDDARKRPHVAIEIPKKPTMGDDRVIEIWEVFK